MSSDYDIPGPSSAGNFAPNNGNESETNKYNYDDCIIRCRTDDDLESSDDENNYDNLHKIDGNVIVSEYRKTLNDDDEDDKRMNKILDYIFSDKETFSESESSNDENEPQYRNFAEFISLLSGLGPSCSEEDEESVNQETASKKDIKEAAQKSTHKEKKNEVESVNDDDTHRGTKEIASTDAKNLITKSKYASITENLPVVLLKRLNEPLIRRREVKKKMKSKANRKRQELNSNNSSSDDENIYVALVKKKKLRSKSKAPKAKVSKDSEYDMSDESDDEVKDKKQTILAKSKLNKQEMKSIPTDECPNINNSQVSDNSTDLFSNIRNILEQSLVNQNQLMDKSNKENYDAILNIINEYDKERRKRSTLEGTDETKEDLLEQSNQKATVSAASSKKSIKVEDAADLLSVDDPTSMISTRSQRLLKNLISAKNNASETQNKPRRKLKFNVSDEETADVKSEVDKNSNEQEFLRKKKIPKRGNISKSKVILGETTSELQTEQGNVKLISKANQSQVSGFNETSDHVNASEKTILSPIWKSWSSPRLSKNKSVIVDDTKNMMTSTPNQNSCQQPKTKVILCKKENTSKSDLVRKTNNLSKKKNVQVSCNESNDDAIANVDPPVQTNAKVSKKVKELQNKKKLSTIDSDEKIKDKQKVSTAEFIGIKGKASTSKSKNLTKDKYFMNKSEDDEDNENITKATKIVGQPLIRNLLKVLEKKVKESINIKNPTSEEQVSDSENKDKKSNGKEKKMNVKLADSKQKYSPLIGRKAIASSSRTKKASSMKMLIQDVENEEMKINPIVNDVKTMARTNNVKVWQSMKKSVSTLSDDDSCDEAEEVNVKENKRNVTATGIIKKGTKTTEVKNMVKSSARKVKENQITKNAIVSSDSVEQNTCKENEVEDINVEGIETKAIKEETTNKDQQDIINASPRKDKHLKNMMKKVITSFLEGLDILDENKVEDINVKKIETNANTTGAIKKGTTNKKGQQLRNNSKASTSKVEELQAKKNAIVEALEGQDTCSEIEDNEVKNKEKLNVGSISQKRTKAAENKQVKNKKLKVPTIKVKKSPKKKMSMTEKEQDSCIEIDHDEVKGKENKSNTIVASTSQKVTKAVESQQVVRKNTTASKRKLKETPNKEHGATVTSEEVISHISKKKHKLNEVSDKNTTINTDNEMDEVSLQKGASNYTQNSKFDCDFSLNNGDTSSIKNESGSVYDKKLQRICDELNASRKSFDFSSGNTSLNDSVRRSGRSRKQPKLLNCMYIRNVEPSTSGKKSISRKSTTVSQTPSNASLTKRTTDQENDDFKQENLQVHDQTKEKKSTKNTSVLKLSTKKKIQSNDEIDGTESTDLGINEGNKNSQTLTEKRKTSDEDNARYSSQDNNESTAASQISGVQSTSSTSTARKKRKLFSPDTYLNSSAIVKCCEYKKT